MKKFEGPPAATMWETYREHALGGMGDISQAICRDVFFSGMSMALSYFVWALGQDEQGEFEKAMQALEDELNDITGDELENIH